MDAGNWVALGLGLATLLGAFTGWGIKMFAGMVDSRVNTGDARLANSIDLLRVSMETISDRLVRSESEHAAKLDAVVHEMTELNDGGTVKGAVFDIRTRQMDHEHRIRHLEGFHD
jgi:hypothetical protein